MKPLDVLIVGGGPAGLAAAIRLKQKSRAAGQAWTVAVIDKAAFSGGHSVSGAALETACLDALVPGWRDDPALPLMPEVTQDEMMFLTPRHALCIPSLLVPRGMHHQGDRVVSLSRLVHWLSGRAVKEGVEVYQGFAAGALLWDKEAVAGVRLVDQGRQRDGTPGAQFLPGEEIRARVTVLADGVRGSLSREFIERTGQGLNPQVYSIGIKQVFKLPSGHAFQAGRMLHTLGFPSKMNVFGGGFFYGMGQDLVAGGIILGLDWPYTDLNPQVEFEILKQHPFLARLLQGARVISAGARMVPEGGYHALGRLSCPGAILVGDAAGFVNMEKIKGIHYAILSGLAAADVVLAGDLLMYERGLEVLGVLPDMRAARNFRACFQAGLLLGAPLSQVQRLIPWRIPMKRDHEHTRSGAQLGRRPASGIDRAAFASLARTMHREDEPPHLVIPDAQLCRQCRKKFGCPCTTFCPVEVYRRSGEEVHISATNCVHCGTCAVKCPLSNIRWIPPEGGEGPRNRDL